MQLLLLPGLDGTGDLFTALRAQLPQDIAHKVVTLNELTASSYQQQANEIADFVKTKPTLLVAESYSGPIAQRICKLYPNNVKAIVFIASFVSPPTRLVQLARYVPAQIIKPVAAIKPFLNLFGFSGTATKNQLSDVLLALEKTDSYRLKQRINNIAGLQIAIEPQSLPVLYLAPTHDRLVTQSAVHHLLQNFPHTQLIQLEGGHFIAQQQPGLCAHHIALFYYQVLESLSELLAE